MSRISAFCDWLLKSPVIWGLLAWLAFDSVIRNSGSEWLGRYFTAEPVHQITTAVFFIGMASLLMRGLGLLGQYGVLRRKLLDSIPAGGQPASEAAQLIEQLEAQPSWLQRTYLVSRLYNAIENVRRRQSADNIEGHLQQLEDADYNRMSAGYAMVRVVTGVVPILGFLGTVIGITMAIVKLSPEQLESSLSEVTAGLGVAFDTTALALALSIVLVFAKLIVERFEENLLLAVGQRTGQELIGRFELEGGTTDPNVTIISRMCDQVVRAVEVMAARQADLWKSTIEETNRQWAEASSTAGEQLTGAVTEGLRTGLTDHATGLTEGIEKQLATLNASLSHQSETLSDSVTKQVEELVAVTSQQSSALTELTERQVAKLGQFAQENADRLSGGADELLGNLRGGLERMAELLVEALQKHGETLTEAEQELASENRRHLSEVEAALGEAMVVAADRQERLIGRSEDLLRKMQGALVDAASTTISHQEQLVKQGEVLLKVVESTGHVRKLEETLNSNLQSLGRAHNFEETLMNLSAAIQLLSARAGRETVVTGKKAA